MPYCYVDFICNNCRSFHRNDGHLGKSCNRNARELFRQSDVVVMFIFCAVLWFLALESFHRNDSHLGKSYNRNARELFRQSAVVVMFIFCAVLLFSCLSILLSRAVSHSLCLISPI